MGASTLALKISGDTFSKGNGSNSGKEPLSSMVITQQRSSSDHRRFCSSRVSGLQKLPRSGSLSKGLLNSSLKGFG